MEEKKGNPYHAKDGKFTSKEGQGQGGSEEKVMNQMGLNKEDTDRQVASDFAEILRKGERIFFAGKSIDLNNVDEFTDIDGSLEEKMYDIVSRETNYEGTKEPVKMPELDNIEAGLDKIVVSGKKIAEKYKQPEQPAKPKIFGNEKNYKALLDSIDAHRKFNKVYNSFSSNEEMADSIAKMVVANYDEDFNVIKNEVLAKLNKMDKEEKETQNWKKAGYEEKMTETPQEIELTDEEGRTRTVDVDWNDYVDFMKSFGVKLTEEQIRNLKENWVLPYEMFDEDTFEDFKEYIKEKK